MEESRRTNHKSIRRIRKVKKRISYFVNHPLISGSSVIFLGMFSSYFIHYLFNLAMGRLLKPAEYGLVTSLVSVTILFSVFQASLTGIFAKFAAKFNALKDQEALLGLFNRGFKLTFIFSLIILGVLLIFFKPFMDFLHISDSRMVGLTYSYIFLSIIASVPNGILQGEIRVYFFSFLNILGALLKILLGIVFVLVGLKAFGAMFAIVVSAFIPYVISLIVIRRRLKGSANDSRMDGSFIKELKGYSLKFFLATLGIAVFTSIDTVFARHFFNPVLAGQYAALALMGKSIFYFTYPIHFVLFPLVAQKKEKKENVSEILMLAALLIALASVAASFFYFLFPGLVLAIFFPNPEYKMLIPYLGPFSLFIIVFSLAYLLNNYLLSLGKTEVFKINISCALLLAILFFFYHSSLFQVIGVLFGSAFLLLVLLLLYYWYNGRD
ncbi:MAG: oligosaccharide flippase family protein [bacterium]|nr:oligosaccharide flippase family protein [bacterium]